MYYMYTYMFNIIVKIPSNKKKHPKKKKSENIHKLRPRGSDFQGREPHPQLGLRMGAVGLGSENKANQNNEILPFGFIN